MPLYEYECEACGHRFEVIQKFSDPLVEVCPKCAARKVHKLLSSPAIQFKGSGWYITDYARKGTTDPDQPKAETTAKKGDETGPAKKADDSGSSSTNAAGSSPGATASTSSSTDAASSAPSPSKNS